MVSFEAVCRSVPISNGAARKHQRAKCERLSVTVSPTFPTWSTERVAQSETQRGSAEKKRQRQKARNRCGPNLKHVRVVPVPSDTHTCVAYACNREKRCCLVQILHDRPPRGFKVAARPPQVRAVCNPLSAATYSTTRFHALNNSAPRRLQALLEPALERQPRHVFVLTVVLVAVATTLVDFEIIYPEIAVRTAVDLLVEITSWA